MAYNISLTNGTSLTSVQDGTVNTTSTSLTLIGKNFAGYGAFLNTNFIKLLENFSNSTQPPAPLAGQCWWDSTNKLLKVYSGTSWKTVSSSQSSGTAPTTPVIGDLWWDTANGQLKVWGGASWVVVGPAYTASQGQTGITADVIVETGAAASHIVSKFFINNALVAVLSKDTSFPVDSLAGFTVIHPGFNLSSTGSLGYYGLTDDSAKLGGVLAANYLRSDENDSTTGTISVLSNNGVLVGASGDAVLDVSGSAIRLRSVVNAKDADIYVTRSNIAVKALSISGTTTDVLLANATPVANLAVASKQYVDDSITTAVGLDLLNIASNVVPDTDNVSYVGTGVKRWKEVNAVNFIGISSQAKYADLAERFEADTHYTAGTVVELGGVAEITKAMDDLSDNVFGVVSTQAAYLMNSDAGTDLTHPAIAMQGRVPVRVIGKVKKGDRLVSAGNGVGRAALKSEVTSFNVIGRALTNKDTEEEGTVEAIVKLNS